MSETERLAYCEKWLLVLQKNDIVQSDCYLSGMLDNLLFVASGEANNRLTELNYSITKVPSLSKGPTHEEQLAPRPPKE